MAGKKFDLLILALLIGSFSYAQQENSKGIRFPNSFYPILPWDFIDSRDFLKDIANCNFTIAGIIKSNDLRRVKKSELKAIGNLELNIKRGTDNGQSLSNLSDAEIDRKVKMLIDRFRNSNAIIGYFLINLKNIIATFTHFK